MTRRVDLNVGDVLLRWMSEREHGTWNELRDAAAGLLATTGSTDSALVLALQTSALGHIDLDWRARTWCVAPPVLAVGRHMGLCAYLAGWRTASMTERFAAFCDDLDCYAFSVEQPSAPTAMFVKIRDLAAAGHVATRLDIRLLWDPAAQLASVVDLPPIDRLEAGAAPVEDDELKRFDPMSGQFEWVERADRDGLFRFPRYGRSEYRLAVDGDWRIVTRAEGMAHVLGGQKVIGWSKASADETTPRAMTVPRWFALPTIAERAAVAASGLLPLVTESVRAYRNVSREVASMIAARLGLGLEIRDRSLPPRKDG